MVAGALLIALAFGLRAAPNPGDKIGPAEKTRKALDRPITVKIEKQTLRATLDQLKQKGDVNIVLDAWTIQQQPAGPSETDPAPWDFDLKEVKLKSALRTVLQPYGLTYVVLGDVIVVTTEEMADLRQMHQVVDVDLEHVEIAEALHRLSRASAVNVLLDSRVGDKAKAKVNLEMEDVPLDTAVRLLSEMAGLKPVKVGNVLFVTTKEHADEIRQDPELTQPGVEMPNPGYKDKLKER
jgi:hypothetical protein